VHAPDRVRRLVLRGRVLDPRQRTVRHDVATARSRQSARALSQGLDVALFGVGASSRAPVRQLAQDDVDDYLLQLVHEDLCAALAQIVDRCLPRSTGCRTQ